MNRSPGKFLSISLAVLGGVLLAAPMNGCNIVGGLYTVAHGPPKIPAVYEPDRTRTTVLLIDDLNNILPRRSLRDRMGSTAEEVMLRNRVITDGNLISSVSARRVVSGEQSTSRMSAVDIAREVGAEVVIHVTMRAWTLQTEPGMISPAAVAEVKVIDAVQNVRIWPPTDEGYPLMIRVPRSTTEDVGTSLADRMRIEEQLADRAGLQLAQMFFQHERERLSEQMRQ